MGSAKQWVTNERFLSLLLYPFVGLWLLGASLSLLCRLPIIALRRLSRYVAVRDGQGFKTPAGLVVNLQPHHAFTLLARVRQAVFARQVLNLTQELFYAPDMFMGLFVISASVQGGKTWSIVAMALQGRIIGVLMLWAAAIGVPLVCHALKQMWFNLGFFASLIAVIFALLSGGWRGLLAYLAAWPIAILFGWLLNDLLGLAMSSRFQRHRVDRTALAFFAAYRYYCHAASLPTRYDVKEADIATGAWYKCWVDYARATEPN